MLKLLIALISISLIACGVPVTITNDGAPLEADAQTSTDSSSPTEDAAVLPSDGSASDSSSPVADGSAPVEASCGSCPAVPDSQCADPVCENGRCGVRNLPDGTGCPGGACIVGRCNRCGTDQQQCCPGTSRCNPGLTCVRNDAAFEYCVGCGGAGQACCGGLGVAHDPGPTFTNPGGSCNAGLSCNAGGTCSCGLIGQACCEGNTCSEGRCFRDGRCGT